MRTLLAVLAISLCAGCGGPGAAPASSVDDAKAALDELVAYRGMGARAARHTLRLVDRIVAGGDALVEPLAKALRESEPFKYGAAGYQKDPRTGVISNYLTPQMAMVEALSRIGGDDAVAALMVASERQRDPETRIVALGFLGPRLDREDVQAHYGRLLERFLTGRNSDTETKQLLLFARGRLDPKYFDLIARAFAAGWARDTVDYEMGDALAKMDEERAATLFLKILADPNSPGYARAAASRCLGRLPAHRRAAAEVLARPEGHRFVFYFLDGIHHGRIGEAMMRRDAQESLDRNRRREYVEGWLEVNRDALDVLQGLAGNLPEEMETATKIREFVDRMKADIAAGERSLANLGKGGAEKGD